MLSRAFTLIGAFALACSTADDHPSVANGSGATGAGAPAGMGVSGVGAGGATGNSGAGGALGGEHTGGAAAGTPSGGDGATSTGGRPAAGGGNTSGAKGDGGRNAQGGKGSSGVNTSGGRGGRGGDTAGGKGGSGGNAGAVTSAGGSGATANVTVWLAGDSTMANGETPCPVGWGKVFKPYFNDRVTITNSAVGGASIRTWLYDVGTTMDASGECVLTTDSSGQPTPQTRWTQMLTGMKAGDYLIVQFGINDGDPSCNRHVGLDAFKASLGVMAQAAKARDATVIFVTPVSAIACNGSTAKGTRGSYVTATLDAAAANDVPVIDLHALSVALYTASGFCPIPGGDVSASTTGPVGDFFCDDHTHFETAGATTIAGLVAKALSDQNIALSAYLK